MITLFAQQTGDAYLRLNRVQSLSEGWHWAVLALLVLALTTFVVLLYRRDGVELSRGAKWSLILLRLVALAALVFYFLDLERGSERVLTKNSRALLLIDTSLSMGLQDEGASSDPIRRVDQVIAEFSQGPLLDELRDSHDVVVYRFDQGLQPTQIAAFKKTSEAEVEESEELLSQRRLDDFRRTRFRMAIGTAVIAAAALLFIGGLVFGAWTEFREPAGWLKFASVVLLLCGVLTLAVANLDHPEFRWRALAGWEPPTLVLTPEEQTSDEESQADEADIVIDWKEQLQPRGVETRLGGALRFLVNKERGGPISGITVFTDGRHNAGLNVAAALTSSQDASIPIYTVGLGSDKRPVNVKLVDVEAPARALPRDGFPVTGYVQAYGMEGRTVRVELFAKLEAAKDSDNEVLGAETLIDETQVKLGSDGELAPIRFETNQDLEGRWNYVLRVAAPDEDRDERDNQRGALVEVLDRKTKVLLIAGGPTREYRFLRNLLFRDPDVTSHVWLQSGQPGISQESDLTLFEFPKLADELFEYDAIVAFDPDWLQLDAQQVEMLERWVAEKGGGLIVVAGPVETPQWANFSRGNDPRVDTIKALYPVIFYSWRSSALSLGRFGGEAVWPIQFTQDGLDAEFLWLEDDALGSEQAWTSFEGVYGYYAVKDPKLGARVYAHFSDPDTSIDSELPIYMAGHFYGAGRVFFQASGEMWRIRAVDEDYFQQYYTKLIRWVAQGRLMRDSSHGVLMVDKDRCLMGDHVTVHAILSDAQFQPLAAPEVVSLVTLPDGSRTNLTMRRVQDGAREGMYVGQFTATQEGDFRIELAPPEAGEGEVLSRTVRSRLPALETEQPQRNDPLLREIADKTQGRYFVGMEAAVFRGDTGGSLASVLEPQDQVTYLPGVPDKPFAFLLRAWLIGLICGALCLEWLSRRLGKLA